MYNPADFFAQIFPSLDERMLVERGEEWFALDRFRAAVQDVRSTVERGTFVPRFAHEPSSEEGQRERHIAMLGIDAAFAILNPLRRAGPVPAALAGTQQCIEVHGRFNDDPQDGLVLPRVAWTQDREDPPLLLTAEFHWLTFVAPGTLRRANVRPAPVRMRMSRAMRIDGFVVGCVPAAEDVDEISFDHGRDDKGEWYVGEMKDTRRIRDRYQAVLEAADAHEVHAMVLPELACSDGLLGFWREALKRRDRAFDKTLRWAMIGTGNLATGGSDHVNAAALVDAATGEPVVIQRKQFPFDIEPRQIKDDYPLPFASGTATLRERIQPGYDVDVVELGAARIAILICEDLARADVLLDELRALGVSHILAPVFSKPTMPFHWEQQKGGNWAGGSGATVVIANSVVVGRLIDLKRGGGSRAPLHASLVVTPWGWRAQRATAGEDLLRFVLRHGETPEACDDPDGSIPVSA